jgi:two-component system response regulator PilR (NtrC family)
LLALQEHDWPGNVRQLANFLHRLCVAAGSDGRIGVDAVRRELLATTPARRAAPRLSARESFLERDREELIAALDDTRWNVSAAARRLGLSRSALRYRMEKHGLL